MTGKKKSVGATKKKATPSGTWTGKHAATASTKAGNKGSKVQSGGGGKKKTTPPPSKSKSTPKKTTKKKATPPQKKSKTSGNQSSGIPPIPKIGKGSARAAKKRGPAPRRAKGTGGHQPRNHQRAAHEEEFSLLLDDLNADALQIVQKLNILQVLADEPSDKLIAAMKRAVEQGVHPEVAARCVGVNSRVFQTWRNKGATDVLKNISTQYAKMIQVLDLAEAQAEMKDVMNIKLGARNGAVLMNFLERRHSNRWGPKPTFIVGSILETAEVELPPQAQPPMKAAGIFAFLQECGVGTVPTGNPDDLVAATANDAEIAAAINNTVP